MISHRSFARLLRQCAEKAPTYEAQPFYGQRYDDCGVAGPVSAGDLVKKIIGHEGKVAWDHTFRSEMVKWVEMSLKLPRGKVTWLVKWIVGRSRGAEKETQMLTRISRHRHITLIVR